MNRDSLKQIMIDQKEIYLNNPLIPQTLLSGRKCQLLFCWHS